MNGPLDNPWPSWKPTAFRILDQWASAYPNEYVPDWSCLEPSSGVFYWTMFDAIIAKYKAEGAADLIMGCESIPPWMGTSGNFDSAAISAFVTAYLTRATADGFPIKIVEGVNEPNDGSSTFSGTVADLVVVQAAIYSAAKAFDPTITVLAPPINSEGSWGYLQEFLTAGGGAYFDALAYHAYPSVSPTKPEQIVSDIAELESLLVAGGVGGKPIWITEYSAGYQATAATNATFLAVTGILAWSLGVVRQYWYAYDNGTGGWGSMETNGVLNAAGIAWEQMVKWLVGATMTKAASVSGVVWTCGFTQANGLQALAVWTADGSTPEYTTPSWAKQYSTLSGSVDTHLSRTTKIGRNPILFES